MSASRNKKVVWGSNLLIFNGFRPYHEINQLVNWVYRPIKCRVSLNPIIHSLFAESDLDLRPVGTIGPRSTIDASDHAIIRWICQLSHGSDLDIWHGSDLELDDYI